MNYKSILNKAWRQGCLFLAVIFIIFWNMPATASANSRTLRVPFVEMEGLMEKGPNGSRRGFVVDYLNEIAKYTNWEYEYIDTNVDDMLNDFIAGEYDLMGGVYYVQVMEEYCLYPDYNMGNSRAVLLARRDDYSIRGTDVRTLNGKTIGVYDQAVENVRRLEEFISANNIDCTLKYYSYEQMSPGGNLYPYLESGEIDLLLGNSGERNTPFRVAFSYNSQPYYIVAALDEPEVLQGLNMALEKILDSNPNFAVERYEANFREMSVVDIHLNEDELEYIRQDSVITVAMPDDFHPLKCSGEECMHDGMTIDILEEVSDFTGLKFTYIYTDSYIDAVHMVQRGEADMMGFFLGSAEESAGKDLVLTAPYASLNSIVARNKTVNFPDEGLVGSVIEGSSLSPETPAEEVRVYLTASDAIDAVNRGEVDFVFGLAPYLESKLQRSYYPNVVPVTIVNDRSDICFALARPADPQLLTILNKAINNISSDRKAGLLDQNMVSVGTGALSITELIYANPVLFIGIFSFILLVAAGGTVWVARTKIKAAVIQGNLKKAEAESRAKGEFLSRMSHELRTPMNAVVGLADLTSMTEGLPDNVCRNLSKLRASAYYLLDLINDILDTSRLDSGMLTIVSEPFSLEHMLDGIRDMLESDARQRGISYVQEKNITHSGVMGDVIRLRQVLTNLLSNAFKFTPSGGRVFLRVTESMCGEQSAKYEFRVIDSGIGIAPEDQKRIFDIFEQVGTNYSKSQGTGLGLPISQRIVQMMGGNLSVTSMPDQGSEFYFDIILPFGDPAEDEWEAQREGGQGNNLDGIRILLVEDNDLNAEIAEELLRLRGAAVTRAENGRLALERFAASKPDEYQVILMDIQMPEMNGLEAAGAIRALERPDAKVIPIVAMTANAFREDVDAALSAGMNEFVSKPMDVEHLVNLLCGLLKGYIDKSRT